MGGRQGAHRAERIKGCTAARPAVGGAICGVGCALSEHGVTPTYLLADANRDLINCYQQFQRGGVAFIDLCASYFALPTISQTPIMPCALTSMRQADAVEKAAIFVYLNRHGYNGLCRYNGSGGFNVPFGRYARPYFPA
jgi:DNA adenine methylase